MQDFLDLFSNVTNFTWQAGLMIAIGCVLIYLAIVKEMEPSLLLPMGFGAVLVNLPFVNTEAIETLFNAGIATELFPLLLFIGIGAMIDFGPLLSNPKMRLPLPLSGQRTVLPPSMFPRCLNPIIRVPSWWRPIPIWRWCPSCSPPSSG